MNGADFVDWLASVSCTKPFTIADARELHALIHAHPALDKAAKVDVYTTRGDVVHVRVETSRGILERNLPIV